MRKTLLLLFISSLSGYIATQNAFGEKCGAEGFLVNQDAKTGASFNSIAKYISDTIAYYKFDVETADTVIDEMGLYHGMVVDAMVAVKGYDSLALSYNADTNYVMVPDNDAINMDTNSFSISALVQFDASANRSMEKNILMKGGTGNTTIHAKGLDREWETTGRWYSFSFKNGELRFYVDDSTNKSQLGVSVVNIVPSDKWVHVVAVRDRNADSLKLFLNGQKIGSTLDITENSITTAGIPLIIGNNHFMDNAFNGTLDELMILGKALSDQEVYDIASKYGLTEMPLKWNVNLISILVNGVKIQPFLGNLIKEYDVDIPEGTTDINIMAITEDGDASVEYTTNADSSVIVVTAQDGVTTDRYVVHFNYISTDASLADLSVSAGTLSPVFSPGTTTYTVTVPKDLSTLSISATANNENATISGIGDIMLQDGQVNTIQVVVTAEDGITSTTYTIVATNAATNIGDMVFGNTKVYFVQDNLIINSDIEIRKAELFDIYGRKIFTRENLGKNSQIAVYGLKNSVYFIILYDQENNISSYKSIKQYL